MNGTRRELHGGIRSHPVNKVSEWVWKEVSVAGDKWYHLFLEKKMQEPGADVQGGRGIGHSEGTKLFGNGRK